MDFVKKRISRVKNMPHHDNQDPEETFINLNLLNTIKLPKNLAHLTKDLPKSNYVSMRGESAIVVPSGGSKLTQSHTGQIRM